MLLVRILDSRGKSQRHLVLSLLATLLLAVIIAPGALAVHDIGVFQLDGNAQTSVDSNPTANDDWDRVCHQVSSTVCPGVSDTTTATAVSWVAEPSGNSTIFVGGGSKDPEDISSWKWKDGAGGLPAKDNLQHAFAARYSTGTNSECPTAPCDFLYFGSDRIDNSGDAVQGFWFLQNEVSPTGTGSGGFSGLHEPGDLLILSNFSNGGSVSTINIYRWVASGGDTTTNLDFLAGGENSKCSAALSVDNYCGIVNSADGTPSPWAFLDKSGNDTYLNGEFFEGGVNLTNLGLGGECFATFLSETRAATSPSATLKDFVLGSFGNCGTSVTTTPKQANGSSIPAAGLSIGTGSVAVKDVAIITGTGGSTDPGGTMKFFLCGPDALGNCLTGGTQFGSPTSGELVVSNGTVGSESISTSDAVTITRAVRSCFRTEYSGDGQFPASNHPETATDVSECFQVNPVTPTLATSAGPDVALGSAVTDTATVTGTSTDPSGNPAAGTITFTLYGPNNCTTLAYTSPGFTVTGDATYGPASFTPTATGTYYWKAIYGGDAPNTNATPTHNADCSDANEDVVVIGTTISTAQSFVPNDSATITASGGGNLAGSVRFRLYTSSNCTTGLLYDSNDASPLGIAVTGASPQTVSSANTTAITTTQTTLSWLVEYTSTNTKQPNATKACNAENSSLTITNGQ